MVKWLLQNNCLYFHVALRFVLPSAKGKIVNKRTLKISNFQANSTVSVSDFIVYIFLCFCPSTLIYYLHFSSTELCQFMS